MRLANNQVIEEANMFLPQFIDIYNLLSPIIIPQMALKKYKIAEQILALY